MNRWAANNPELAAQGQFYPGGSPSPNPSDHADYCDCNVCTCECGNKYRVDGDCHNRGCKDSASFDAGDRNDRCKCGHLRDVHEPKCLFEGCGCKGFRQ